MNLTEINLREKNFHNKLQSKKKGRFENIFYKAIYNSGEDFFAYLKDNTKNSGTVIQEIQKGYMMKDRLLRPSLVGVTKKREGKVEKDAIDVKNNGKKDEKK